MSDDLEQPYDGRRLVSDDSLLRKIPNLVTPQQRMILDALVYSTDAIEFHWHGMRKAAVRLLQNRNDAHSMDRIAILAPAWALVDQFHAISEIIHHGKLSDAFDESLIAELRPYLKVARYLRNRMDHVGQNLRNIAAAKGTRTPLLGSVSYVHMGAPGAECASVVAVRTGVFHGPEKMAVVNPLGRRIALPVDLFTLSAFRRKFEIGAAISALARWLDGASSVLELSLETQLQTHSQETGIPVEKLREFTSGLVAILTYYFDQKEPQAQG